MKTIYLHAGHGKTGSSFLQSTFALNVATLEAAGIDYPLPDRMRARAASGVTTSGNRAALVGALRADDETIFDTQRSLLFSGEGLWSNFLEPDFTEKLTAGAARSGHRLAMLLFLRDPVEFQISVYLQNVQQGLEQAEINDYMAGRGARLLSEHLERVSQVIDKVRAAGCDLKVMNYSRVKRDLPGVTMAFLGFDPKPDLTLPGRTVNRSIGALEVGMARGLAGAFQGLEHPENRNYLKRAIDATAELSMAPPAVDPAAVATFSDKVAPAIEMVNTRLDADQALRLHHEEKPVEDTPPGEEYGLRMAQEISLATLRVALENLGEDAQNAAARETLLAMIAANPHADLPQLRAYADLLLARKARKQALPVLERLVQLEDVPETRLRLANVLAAMGRHEEALALSQAIVVTHPKNERANSLVVRALLALERPDAALEAIADLRTRDLCTQQRDFWAFRAARQQGDDTAARAYIDAACEIAPDNEKFREAQAAMKPSLKRTLKGVLKR